MYRKWNFSVICMILLCLFAIAFFNGIIDPFFHYRAGLEGLEYPLTEERYINDGMQRHYDYDVLITGTSMSWNFLPSVAEEKLGGRVLKTAYSGAYFHELSESMEQAISHNPDLRMIICSLDPNVLTHDAYEDAYKGAPYYLYDENPFNDASYLLNKEVVTKSIAVINYTRAGNITTSPDDYGRFELYMPSGREAVLNSYERQPVMDSGVVFDGDDRDAVHDNLTLNFIETAKNNPDITFVFYIPPYSYCFWDAMVRTGQLDYVLDAEEYAVGLLLETENIKVYAFDDDLDITTDLDNYTDTLHYTSDICNIIAERIGNDECRLTADDYHEYFEKIGRIYREYEYDL